jgi:hypothetical protein
MKKALQIISILFLVSACTTIQGNESGWVIFNCEDEFAFGIAPVDDNEWELTRFNELNFTLALSNDLKEIKLSNEPFQFVCSRYISTKLPFLTCTDSYNNGMIVKFNTETYKYIFSSSSHSGYTNNGQTDSDSLHAGNCKKFLQ